MLRITIVLILMLWSKLGITQHKDYFEKEGFDILNGLLLDLKKIEKIQDSTIVFFKTDSIITQRFKLKSKIKVQVACHVNKAEFEEVNANYTIAIGEDRHGSIRRKFADSIYNHWIEKSEAYLDGHKQLPAYKHIFYEKGDYIMYLYPGSNLVGQFYLLYFDEKIIRITFNGTDHPKGWGGLSSFLSKIVQFNFAKRKIKPSRKSLYDPRKFIALYESGFFK